MLNFGFNVVPLSRNILASYFLFEFETRTVWLPEKSPPAVLVSRNISIRVGRSGGYFLPFALPLL